MVSLKLLSLRCLHPGLRDLDLGLLSADSAFSAVPGLAFDLSTRQWISLREIQAYVKRETKGRRPRENFSSLRPKEGLERKRNSFCAIFGGKFKKIKPRLRNLLFGVLFLHSFSVFFASPVPLPTTTRGIVWSNYLLPLRPRRRSPGRCGRAPGHPFPALFRLLAPRPSSP